eukprot:1156123-Pelagomonas_calceolata.AAC.5
MRDRRTRFVVSLLFRPLFQVLYSERMADFLSCTHIIGDADTLFKCHTRTEQASVITSYRNVWCCSPLAALHGATHVQNRHQQPLHTNMSGVVYPWQRLGHQPGIVPNTCRTGIGNHFIPKCMVLFTLGISLAWCHTCAEQASAITSYRRVWCCSPLASALHGATHVQNRHQQSLHTDAYGGVHPWHQPCMVPHMCRTGISNHFIPKCTVLFTLGKGLGISLA